MQSLLDTVKEEIQEVNKVWLKNEYIKVGAAAALAVCGSLRGPEVFLLDLTGLRKYITLGHDGVLPDDPLNPGADFINYPYIIVTLIGEFKGELGTKHHPHCPCQLYILWNRTPLVVRRATEGTRDGRM
jgi:hypothetical protein